MKQTKEFRSFANSGDSVKKAVKLEPIRKSGKDRHQMFDNMEDEEDLQLDSYKKRESVLDYFDDGEEGEEED